MPRRLGSLSVWELLRREVVRQMVGLEPRSLTSVLILSAPWYHSSWGKKVNKTLEWVSGLGKGEERAGV